jgi:hypothetical protein
VVLRDAESLQVVVELYGTIRPCSRCQAIVVITSLIKDPGQKLLKAGEQWHEAGQATVVVAHAVFDEADEDVSLLNVAPPRPADQEMLALAGSGL